MRVLKVVAEGLTTSFRYPHFIQGVHPSFPTPPPATIYGHVTSALGEWVDPLSFRFAYHFTYDATFEDLEHIHLVIPATGKLKGTSYPKVQEGAVNPFRRSLLFRPRLVLYLTRPDWKEAFCSPRYPVVLGRSQDLFTYTSVSVVNLVEADRAYFEHTLAPYSLTRQTARGLVLLMPQYLDYQHNRKPRFARYVYLNRRVFSNEFLQTEADSSKYWVDPTAEPQEEAFLGLFFLGFGEEEANVSLPA